MKAIDGKQRMKVGDLVRAHNKAQTIGVVMCVDSASGMNRRIQVFAEGEIQWWWKDNATIISEVVSETKKPMITGDAITMLRSGKLKSNKRYFAKPDTWFKEGTEAFYEEEIYPIGTLFDEDGISHGSAIYRGTYVVGPNEDYDTYWHSKGYKEGDEVEMREHCCNSEFVVVEKEND